MVSEWKSFIFHYRNSLFISKRDVSGSVLEAAPVSVSYIVVGSENGPFAFKAPDCLLLCAAERLTPSGQWTLQRHHSILESGEVQRGVKERSFPEDFFFPSPSSLCCGKCLMYVVVFFAYLIARLSCVREKSDKSPVWKK